jgi:hypothetical protein
MTRNCSALISVFGLVAFAFACAQTPPLDDTAENRLEQARALTALEVESGALDAMLDEGAALAREATTDLLMLELEREPTADDLAAVEEIMRAGLAEFLTAEVWQETVAAVYAPVGRKILSHGQVLDQAVGEAVEAALEAHHDEFAARVDAALAERFPELAEGGSR